MKKFEIWIRPRMWYALILFYYLKFLKWRISRLKRSKNQIDSVYTDIEYE